MLVAMVFFASCTVLAQERDHGKTELVQPSRQQVDLYYRALEAHERGEYNEAIRLYEELLAMGELNAPLLALGRSLQKAGRCLDAALVFNRARTAPKVESPPPDELEAVLDRYFVDLLTTCAPYRETLRLSDELARHVSSQALGLNRTKPSPPELDRDPEPAPLVVSWLDLSLTGGGAVSLVAAGVLGGVVLPDAIDEFEAQRAKQDPSQADSADKVSTLQSTTWVLTTVGFGLVLGAVAHVVWVSYFDEQPPDRLSMELGTDGSALLRLSW